MQMCEHGCVHVVVAHSQLVEVVCCKMTEMQQNLYNHFLESKAAARLLNQGKGGTKVLGAITALKKLCNHPKLIYDVIHSKQEGTPDGFEGCEKFFPPGAQ
jgi:DNA repair and recombination protein RAD54 and RAD54-like protein